VATPSAKLLERPPVTSSIRPIVMVVGVIPGALAFRAAPPEDVPLVEPAVVGEELVPFELPHPAATTAVTPTATANV
jgi:hypothetical protein